MNHKHPAMQIIAKEYARDLVGEHEMGMRIMGEQFAKRVYEALNAAGYVIINDRTDPEGGIPGRTI